MSNTQYCSGISAWMRLLDGCLDEPVFPKLAPRSKKSNGMISEESVLLVLVPAYLWHKGNRDIVCVRFLWEVACNTVTERILGLARKYGTTLVLGKSK